MELWKASCPGSWLLGLCLTPTTPSLNWQWPACYPKLASWSWVGTLGSVLKVATFVLSGCSKRQRRHPVFGMGSVQGGECVACCSARSGVLCISERFCSKSCICATERTDVSFRSGSADKCCEKEGEPSACPWGTPYCPLNNITAFTRPLLFLRECNTINKKRWAFRYVGIFFSKPNSLPHAELTRAMGWMKGKFISERILLIICPFDGDESFCKAW